MKKFWLEEHMKTYFSQAEDKVMNLAKLMWQYPFHHFQTMTKSCWIFLITMLLKRLSSHVLHRSLIMIKIIPSQPKTTTQESSETHLNKKGGRKLILLGGLLLTGMYAILSIDDRGSR
jgi:hypothetical protein